MQWLAGAEVGNAAGLAVGRMVMAPGAPNRPHRHDNCEKAIVVVRGCVEHVVGGACIAQRSGDVVVIPEGTVHMTTNICGEEAELLIAFGADARAYHPEA